MDVFGYKQGDVYFALTIELDERQLHWLLQGYDITKMQPHRALSYQTIL